MTAAGSLLAGLSPGPARGHRLPLTGAAAWRDGGPAVGMTTHHERVRAVRLVARITSTLRAGAGGSPVAASERLGLLGRARARRERLWLTARDTDAGDSGQVAWKLAACDAALAEPCDGLGLPHALDDPAVPSGAERARVELALLEAPRTLWRDPGSAGGAAGRRPGRRPVGGECPARRGSRSPFVSTVRSRPLVRLAVGDRP